MLRFVTLGTLLASPALAAEQPRIAVVGVHQAELTADDQGRTIERMVQAIEGTGRFDALGPPEVAGAIQGRETVILEEALLASAREKLATGKGQYNQAAPEDAIATLETAIEEFEGAIAATRTVDDLWEAWVYVGTSHLQRDPPDEAAAAAAFQNAIALAPARPLNAALFPPYVVEAYQAEKASLEATLATLEVYADEPATIWVDGIERGTGDPVAIEGLLPGVHYVVAQGDGTQAFQRVMIEAPAPTATQTVRLSMTPPTLGKPASSPAGRSLQTGALYGALGNRSEGVEYFLLAGVEGQQLHLQLLDTRTDAFSRSIEIPFVGSADDEAAQTVPLVLNLIDKEGGFTATSATAAPLDVGANSELALMILQPRPPAPTRGGTGEPVGKAKGKGKAGMFLGVTAAVLAAGGASAGVYFLTRPGETDPNQGTILIQF